jgi:hypothetical protein
MKKFLLVFTILNLIFASQVKAGDVEDIFRGVLGGLAGPKSFQFHPGDAIYSKTGEAVYYSGYEIQDGKKVLLLTLVKDNTAILLKYPQPDVIQIRNIKIKVLGFSNTILRLQEVY